MRQDTGFRLGYTRNNRFQLITCETDVPRATEKLVPLNKLIITSDKKQLDLTMTEL